MSKTGPVDGAVGGVTGDPPPGTSIVPSDSKFPSGVAPTKVKLAKGSAAAVVGSTGDPTM